MGDVSLYMPYIWLGAAVLLGIAEAMTDQLVAIWFAVGAVCAMLFSYTGLPVWTQFLVFVLVSAAVLCLLRPAAAKLMNRHKVRTNVDSIIGMIGVVTSDVDNAQSIGRVMVNNSDWAAISEDGALIPKGERVLIKSVTGVKVVVESII